MTPLTDAELGRKIRGHFDRGRALAIQRAQARNREHAKMILDLLQLDLAKNRPARGRAGRITRRLAALGVKLSGSQVRRILSTLVSVRDPVGV